MSSETNENSGCGCESILAVWLLLIVLKATGVLNLSWLIVLSSFIWLPLAVIILTLVLVFILGAFFLTFLAVVFIPIFIVVLCATIITEIFDG
jgi:hypothetical protein